MRNIQCDLFVNSAARSEEQMRRLLADESGCRVELALTRNRVSMASVRFVNERHARVRLHARFLEAPHEVWLALARFLRVRKRADWKIVADFAAGIDTSTEYQAAKTERLRVKGAVYDLGRLARGVNREFFNGRIKYRIGWGRQASSRRRGRRGVSIRYGSWTERSRTIRIHPLLDDERVPQRFVEFIIYHEMLHAIVPGEQSNSRRQDHPLNFRKLERAFPEYDEMQRLAGELLHLLKGA